MRKEVTWANMVCGADCKVGFKQNEQLVTCSLKKTALCQLWN